VADFGEGVTDRLSCRRPDRGSLDLYRELFTDREVNRWLRPEPMKPFSPTQIDRLFRYDRAHWRQHGYGPWILRERESGAFVGRGGLAWTMVEGVRMVELPWALLTRFHGLGYATEQALAAIATARAFGLGSVVSLTLPWNAASRRVMEKAGLSLVGEVDHMGMAHVLYRLDLT